VIIPEKKKVDLNWSHINTGFGRMNIREEIKPGVYRNTNKY